MDEYVSISSISPFFAFFSDHCPILLDTDIESKIMSRRVFRFEAWWVKEENCVDEIRRLWQLGRGDILEKLKLLQSGLMR